jgi:hypothetical protein
VWFWTARKSDIGREAGLGLAVSLISSASLIWRRGTTFLSKLFFAKFLATTCGRLPAPPSYI